MTAEIRDLRGSLGPAARVPAGVQPVASEAISCVHEAKPLATPALAALP